MMKRIVVVIMTVSLCLAQGFAAVPFEAYRAFARGLLAARSGDVPYALQEYERVVRLDHSAAAVYRDLALLYWQTGRNSDALAAAAEFEKTAGDSLSTQLFLGSFYFMAGQPDLSLKAWEKVLKIDPQNATAILHLAAYHSTGPDPGKAVDYWNKFIRQEPDSAEAHYQLGMVQNRLGRYESAKESFLKCVALKPDNPDACIPLAQLYEKEGNLPAATREYERYLRLVPDNLAVLQYLGGLYYRNKDFPAAEDVFSRAHKLRPDDTNLNFWRGILAEERKDWPTAISCFELISKSDPNPAILTRLSYYYTMMKDHRRAIRYLKKVVKTEPRNPQAYYLLALAYFDGRDYLRAKENFSRALALKPDLVDIHYHLGVLYDQWGKFEKAERELKRVLELDPDHASALNYLAYSYADRKIRLGEAEALIKRAVEIEPDNGPFVDSLGWVYYQQGRYDEAQRELRRAVSLFSDPIIWEHLGDAGAKLNRQDDAWEAYRKAVTLAPKDRRLVRKVREMEKRVLPSTIQRKVLKRAVGNLLQIKSLKANFTVSGKSPESNFRFFGLFQYTRPQLWRADILGNFMAPQVVIIQNQGIKVYPDAMSGVIAGNGSLFDEVKDFLNARLLDAFDSGEVTASVRGRLVHYSRNGVSAVIDRETGTVREYRVKDRLVLTFKEHACEEGLYLPALIEMYLPAEKLAASVRLQHFTLNAPIEENVFTLSQ